MSNWPQAVWIVKKLQKNFDFSQEINNFMTELNKLNTKLSNDEIIMAGLEGKLETEKTVINQRYTTFIDQANTNVTPKTYTSGFSKGTIWLVAR